MGAVVDEAPETWIETGLIGKAMRREQWEGNIGIKGVSPESGTGVNTWNPSNWEVKGGHPQTHRELKARLDYMKTCLQ